MAWRLSMFRELCAAVLIRLPERESTHHRMEVSQRDRVTLHYDRGSQLWLLHDSVLGRTCCLPTAAGWSLLFDERGMGFVKQQGSEDNVVQWASEFFAEALLENVAGHNGFVVLTRNGDLLPLQEYKQEHDTLEVPVREHGTVKVVLVVAFLLQRWWGAFCFWSLKSLRGAFVGDANCSASAWYQNWWVWWEKYLSKRSASPRSCTFVAPCRYNRRRSGAASTTPSTAQPPGVRACRREFLCVVGIDVQVVCAERHVQIEKRVESQGLGALRGLCDRHILFGAGVGPRRRHR